MQDGGNGVQSARPWRSPERFSGHLLNLTGEGIVFVHPVEGIVFGNQSAISLLKEGTDGQLANAVQEFAKRGSEEIQSYPLDMDGVSRRVFHFYRLTRVPEIGAECVGVRIVERTELEDLKEFKRRLLAHLTHEIRTPLASLTLSTRLLAKSAQSLENPLLRASAETTVIDVDRLRLLVEDVLSISRFHIDSEELEISREDFLGLLQQTERHLRRRMKERAVTLIRGKGFEGLDSFTVRVDRRRMLWAFSNLMGVALERVSKGAQLFLDISFESGTPRVWISGQLASATRTMQEAQMGEYGSEHCLGLTIARRIFREHKIELRTVMEDDDERKFEFSFVIPRERIY